VTNPEISGRERERLLAVDPERLSREALIRLVRDLQGALGGGAPTPDRPARAGIKSVPGVDYTLVFDGGSLGNPGLGYGSYEVAAGGDSVAAERIEFGDGMTNNQAEFHALIAGLEALLALTGDKAKASSVAIRGDSQLVIRGLTGEWRVKHPGLQPLHRKALDLLGRFGSVDLAWHGRANSVRAFGH
jgi:ribonuclease HI